MQKLQQLGGQLAAIWGELGVNQKVTTIAGALAMAIGLAVVMGWAGSPDTALLYGNLDNSEAGRVMKALDDAKVTYDVSQGGGAIYVPSDKVHQLRAQLATQGIPKGEGLGFELFDKSTLGMSDFMQRANYNRAIQGELARTIAKFDGIESARIMIVAPENRLLIDPGRHPSASVFLNVRGVAPVKSETVSAVRMLVSNSIEGLQAHHVSVVDNMGNVLSSHEEGDSMAGMSSGLLKARRDLESYLSRKVETMLEKVVGYGNVVARVSAEVNTDAVTLSREHYHDGAGEGNEKLILTETINLETSKEGALDPGGTASLALNTGAAGTSNAVAQATDLNTFKRDGQVEYAIAKDTTNIVQIAGGITRVTAAVFVNNLKIDESGQQTTNALNTATLQLMAQKALGQYATADDVQVEAVPFQASVLAHEIDLELDSANSKIFYWDIAKNAVYVTLIIGGLFLVWKLFRKTQEEWVPTGVPVGQLVGGVVPMTAAAGVAPVAGMAPAAGAAPGAAVDTTAQMDTAAMNLEDIDAQLKDPSKLSVEQIKQLKQRKKEEKERINLLKEMDEDEEDDVEMVQQEKQKLVMDFGLGQKRPERVTVEVLKDLIVENPGKMSQAARSWLSAKDSGAKS